MTLALASCTFRPHCRFFPLNVVTAPVFVCESSSVGSHSELAKELSEPLLDLTPLLAAFVPAASLSSSSEAVAVKNARVVKSRHDDDEDSDTGTKTRRVRLERNTEPGQTHTGCSVSASREKLNSFLSSFPRVASLRAALPGL